MELGTLATSSYKTGNLGGEEKQIMDIIKEVVGIDFEWLGRCFNTEQHPSEKAEFDRLIKLIQSIRAKLETNVKVKVEVDDGENVNVSHSEQFAVAGTASVNDCVSDAGDEINPPHGDDDSSNDIPQNLVVRFSPDTLTSAAWDKPSGGHSFKSLLEMKKMPTNTMPTLFRENFQTSKPFVKKVWPMAPLSSLAITCHRLVLLDGKKEKDCYVCSDRSAAGGRKRKRSRRWCPLCEVGCHEKCEPMLEHTTGLGRLKRQRN